MKFIELFEQYNEQKYAVTATYSGKSYINVNHPYPNRVYKTDFSSIDKIVYSRIQKYTSDEADKCIEILVNQWKQDKHVYNYKFEKIPYKFEKIPIEDIKILINANKYNL